MTSLVMPEPDQEAIAKKDEIVDRLREIVPGEGVISSREELRAYECDGLSAYRQIPLAVVLPSSTEQISRVVRLCDEEGIKVVPRGAGTSLSGGALPVTDGIVLGLGKLNRILDIDYENRCVVAQPGVTNLGITKAVEHKGFYYAPDPSSQIACTIGGNIGENAGGVHCLKYGLTTNNVLGLEMVLPNGDVIRLGGKHLDSEGYDLMGLMTGSEGLLGIVTEVTLRILQKPETLRAVLMGFPSVEAGGDCVAAIIARGIIPGGLEMMDHPAINAAEDFCNAGYPRDAQSLLICELDGPAAEVDHLIEIVTEIARDLGATHLEVSESEEQRLLFWAGRKNAFPAAGRISPDYICMDGTIPRSKLAHVLRRMQQMSAKHGLGVANVFHAGDGNLHPLILFDANNPGELERAEAFGADILKLCVEVGGVLTGEHGVGVEEARPHARDVQRRRSEPAGARQMRVRPQPDPQSGQDVSSSSPLR